MPVPRTPSGLPRGGARSPPRLLPRSRGPSAESLRESPPSCGRCWRSVPRRSFRPFGQVPRGGPQRSPARAATSQARLLGLPPAVVGPARCARWRCVRAARSFRGRSRGTLAVAGTPLQSTGHRSCSGPSLLLPCEKCRQQASQLAPIACFAFPNDENLPPEGLEFGDVPPIPFHVSLEFPLPERRARLRRRCPAAIRMPVPEAAVYEDDLPRTRKRDVRGTRQIAAMKAEAIAQGVDNPPHGKLGSGVTGTNTAHQRRSRRIDRLVVRFLARTHAERTMHGPRLGTFAPFNHCSRPTRSPVRNRRPALRRSRSVPILPFPSPGTPSSFAPPRV